MIREMQLFWIKTRLFKTNNFFNTRASQNNRSSPETKAIELVDHQNWPLQSERDCLSIMSSFPSKIVIQSHQTHKQERTEEECLLQTLEYHLQQRPRIDNRRADNEKYALRLCHTSRSFETQKFPHCGLLYDAEGTHGQRKFGLLASSTIDGNHDARNGNFYGRYCSERRKSNTIVETSRTKTTASNRCFSSSKRVQDLRTLRERIVHEQHRLVNVRSIYFCRSSSEECLFNQF